MKKKYHISDSGEVVVCEATEKICPKQNFDSEIEAQQHLNDTYGHTHTLNKKVPETAAQSIPDAYASVQTKPYEINLPKKLEKVLDDLYEIGNPLIVGGSVRDSFVKADNKDYDIEVHGVDIDELIKHLKKNNYKIDEVGKSFGVLKVAKGDISDLDISVPRIESRVSAGHRGFEVELDKGMTIEEAADRRDFTFNAMMYDHKHRLLIDPNNGEQDFSNKVIKHVSPKFAEDPLRVLRGFQFAGRFGMTLDPKTAQFCKDLRKEYDDLSIERVQTEWEKFYDKSTNHSMGLQALKDSGWDDISPGLRESLNNDKVLKAFARLKNVNKDREIVGSAIIAATMSKDDARAFLKYSVISNKSVQQVNTLVKASDTDLSSSYKRKVFARANSISFNFERYLNYAQATGDNKAVAFAQRAINDGLANGPESPLVSGGDILSKVDRAPGPWMKTVLEKTIDAQYKGKFKNKDEAFGFAMSELRKLD